MSRVHSRVSNKVLIDDTFHVVDLKKSNGSWFVDAATGNQYLDCFSQFASMPVGWNHPKVRKYGEQHFLPEIVYHKIANSDILSEAYGDFCDKFDNWTADFKYHFYICGGALGVENALKAAFDYKAQKLGLTDDAVNMLDVIHLKQAFHGRSGYTLSLTNTDPDKTRLFPKFPWTRIHNPKLHFPIDQMLVDGSEAMSLGQAECVLAKNNVAAIIVEPIQGEGGDNHFSRRYLRALRHLATEHDAMLIFDEVQTGMGLTGRIWCYRHFDLVPDMICFGKKSQVCGFACTDKIDNVPTNVFKVQGRINSTWGGNIVDMVRSTIYMRIIEEDDLVANAEKIGNVLAYGLRRIGEPITNVRNRGLMVAFDLPDTRSRDAMLYLMKKKMLALKCGEKSIRLRPALTFSEEDANTACEIIEGAKNVGW